MENSLPAASAPLPGRLPMVLYILICLVALAGLTEATYLTVLALTGETAICGGSAGCFQVLGSSYAKIKGFPLAGLGALAYFSVFTFSVFAAFGYRRARLFLVLTIWAMFFMTLWLLYLQAFVLHAFCRYCLGSAAMIFLLTGLIVASPPPEARE